MLNRDRRLIIRALPILFVILSLACTLPITGRPTPTAPGPTAVPTAPPPPTPTQQPLPPALVESDPPPGAEIPLKGPITLYFNQPMDRASVESAFTSQPRVNGRIAWVDDATLAFTPGQPLAPASDLALNLRTAARSASGLALTQPLSLTYHTAGFLKLTQSLPEADATEVNPTSAVVAAFNLPVVPLGADPATLPPAFSLAAGSGTSPSTAQGHGEWINTSTYVFYPDPALEGGKSYTASLNPDLHSAAGSPLEISQAPAQWSFTTALPRLVSMQPAPGSQSVRLDAKIALAFNQPMDPTSVEANFTLAAPASAALVGTASWNDNFTEFTFTPRDLLARNSVYRVTLNGQAQARGGTSLGTSFSASLQTVPALSVKSTVPAEGGSMDPYGGPVIYFSAPLRDKDLLQFLTISPAVPNLSYFWSEQDNSLHLSGFFAASTAYNLSLSSDLPDPWGGTLGQPFVLNFRTGPLQAGLVVSTGSDVLFLTPQDPSLSVQATNVFNVPISLGSLPLSDFITMLGPDGYNFKQSYQAAGQRSWTQALDIPPDQSQVVDLNLSPDQSTLASGLYFMRFTVAQQNIYPGPFLLVVSNVQLTIKLSATDALVWAVDLRSNAPVAGAPVTIYAEDGQALASGQTDANGLMHVSIPPIKDPYTTSYAVLGQPGQEIFGAALSTWNQGLANWDFGIPADFSPPHLKAYLYTDRPIYRPGQTVYFRAVTRQAYNGRYTLPQAASLPLTLHGESGQELATFDLSLSAFGTGHGEYTLPAGARPGYYNLQSPDAPDTFLNFQVAEYRKPEINLQVSFAAGQVQSGQPLSASLNARYFFDAPAGNLPVHWALYAAPTTFDLPGYQVGVEDTRWLEAFTLPSFTSPLGEPIAEGDAQTAPDGTLSLDLPPVSADSRQQVTLEVTGKDESGLPVSARATAQVNPADFYIGLQPDSWVGRAGEQAGFAVQVVDWDRNPAGVRSLHAEFKKVEWVRQDPSPGSPFLGPTFQPRYTPVDSSDGATNDQGQARLAFVPPDPGTYLLSVSGDGTRSDLLLWVGGPGQAVWPNLPNQRLRLTADRASYQPGETAQVFIPNPFGASVQALVTVERGIILREQIVTLDPGGSNLSFPLTAEDAPNVYVSVTLLGRTSDNHPDFRQGYVDLPVQPVEQILNVALTSQPQRAGPGDNVTFEVSVTDAHGQPVAGEFSLSVVDLAALALADPNAPDIVPAFYAEQALGVRTSLSLAAYTRRLTFTPPGLGGGGGGDVGTPQVVRDRFPDTAYWNAEIVTGPDGKALVSLPLPDTLTTWQIDARGLTKDTLVGQAKTQVVATKDLLVRPVTPRFLVVDDHAQLAAIVQNNTSNELAVDVVLQASGFNLDDPSSASQHVTVPAQGRTRVEWWGVAQDVESADLVFSARAAAPAGGAGQPLEDAARPEQGPLPVLSYTARQTFNTSGTLEGGGDQANRLELVSLPRSFDPRGGSLDVELSPSLAAAMLKALDALENSPYDSTEATLSRFLPNLETYRALQQFGVQSPTLQSRLERTLNEGLQSLLARQNPDGGWSWWQDGESDPYITAYVLFGLTRLQEAGIAVSSNTLQQAVSYLQAGLAAPQSLAGSPSASGELDRLAFEHFALASAGAGDLSAASSLYELRDQLNPWAQAVLALTLERLSPGSQQARTLISDLESTAIRSASGVHWETRQAGGDLPFALQNMISTISDSAIVVYALSQRSPGSPLLADAVRYLMANRQADGGWASTYSTAWTVMAMTEVLKGTGELGGDFAFSASLNGAPLASGQASGPGQLNPVSASVPLNSLYPNVPNALLIQRENGPGRLYYTAALNVSRPVESITPLSNGLSVSRAYYTGQDACPQDNCPAIQSAATGERVTARLTLTLPHDAYYLMVEDYIPAGAEILDTSLKTTQQGEGGEPQAQANYDPSQPFAQGWGWWYFHTPQVHSDRITWAADYLPAGTYQLTYTLVILQPGEYRVLPAHAWESYFPDVQANSAGDVFEIKP